ARGAGEPALIAGIVHEVVARHGADARRIFVAGLSAGAAMAVILGETHPELFAGVGAHSGLPYGSAHDVPSALAAMKGGRGKAGQVSGLAGTASGKRGGLTRPVPTIVFHGDRDHTVQHSNGTEIARQASAAYATQGVQKLQVDTQRNTAAGGRSVSRTVHTDAAGQAHIECWTLHGAGHAWSGGSPEGTHTDTKGPDASAEMVRFFLTLPGAGTA
ncbi:MAG: PHB depolymerase family esterase, partial [Rubrivivax sp.]|nr:PHB depolymerase family esterase [Rubrivivax sp.]